MTATPTPLREIVAAAIANARGARRGAPAIQNVLAILPERLRAEVLDDADSVLDALKKAGHAGAVAYAELPAKMAYDIDPDTGADRGSCCGHAYADGWNDCIEAVQRVPATPPASGEAGAVDWIEAERMACDALGNANLGPRESMAALAAIVPVVRELADRTRLAAVAPAGMDGWQPIETAPKDGTYILVTNHDAGGSWVAKYEPVYGSGYRPDNPWMSMMLNAWHLPNRNASRLPTHWQPLPTPPATAGKE